MDNYFYLPKAHQPPVDHEIPPVDQWLEDAHHPELNSKIFTNLVNQHYEEPKDFLPVYSLLDLSNGLFVLGTNNFKSAMFDGNFIGTENFEHIAKHELDKTSFVIPQESTVTGLKFIEENMFVTTTMNCDMDLWKQSVIQDEPHPFKCDNVETSRYVSFIDNLKNEHKFVTASKKGYFEVYDFGLTEVIKDFEILYGNSITGISANPSSHVWASTSVDRCCLMWDKSKFPSCQALSILRNYEHQLTSVYWTTQRENKGYLMVGDETGNVLTLDPRVPNKILQKTKVSTRAVSQICFKSGSNRLAVLANHVAKVLEVDPDGELKLIHEHTAPVILYALCWDESDDDLLYVVGEAFYAEKINI